MNLPNLMFFNFSWQPNVPAQRNYNIFKIMSQMNLLFFLVFQSTRSDKTKGKTNMWKDVFLEIVSFCQRLGQFARLHSRPAQAWPGSDLVRRSHGISAVAPRWPRGGPAAIKETILDQGCFWGAKTNGFIDWQFWSCYYFHRFGHLGGPKRQKNYMFWKLHFFQRQWFPWFRDTPRLPSI